LYEPQLTAAAGTSCLCHGDRVAHARRRGHLARRWLHRRIDHGPLARWRLEEFWLACKSNPAGTAALGEHLLDLLVKDNLR
jgi:hypothetical protein